jgi:hypothetical protein
MEAEFSGPRARGVAPGLARLRRGSLAVLVLLVVEYAIGMYVNLYVTVPGADHGGGLGGAIANGPAALSLHAVLGLLLGLGALGAAVQAVAIRHGGLIALSVTGLLAMIFASVAGTGFTNSGDDSASMAMSVLTGIAMLCYAANLYLLRAGTGPGPARSAAQDTGRGGSRAQAGRGGD